MFEELEAMASPPATGVAARTPFTSRMSSSKSLQCEKPPMRLASILTCALLPKILCLRSAPKPPMIETTAHSANELTPTPEMDQKGNNRQKSALLSAHVARSDERHETTTFEAIHQPRHGQDHEADHERRARERGPPRARADAKG